MRRTLDGFMGVGPPKVKKKPSELSIQHSAPPSESLLFSEIPNPRGFCRVRNRYRLTNCLPLVLLVLFAAIGIPHPGWKQGIRDFRKKLKTECLLLDTAVTS